MKQPANTLYNNKNLLQTVKHTDSMYLEDLQEPIPSNKHSRSHQLPETLKVTLLSIKI